MNKNNKLRAQLVSDLHLEFRASLLETEDFICSLTSDADVLVLAGDITISKFLKPTIRMFCKYWPHIVYVTGNHTYYGASFGTVHKKLKELSEELNNFHWLNNSEVIIDGQRFLGGTLWFEENKDSTDFWLQQGINDFRMIKDFREKVFTEHNFTYKYLQKEVKENDIVVTHHLVHPNCVDPKYKGNRLNCFYVTDMSPVINVNKPKYILHGHGHNSVDIVVNKTRILCNAYGYWQHETNPDFKENLIINI